MPTIEENNPNGLTPRQLVFCQQYIKHWNAPKAAAEAGYSGDENTIRSMAAENLSKPAIKAEISRLAATKLMPPEQILDELKSMAATDLEDFLEFKDGISVPYLNFRKAKEAGVLKNVRKFRLNADGTVDFELYDRREAMTLLGKAHALWRDRLDLTSNNKEIPTVALAPGLLSTILQGQEAPQHHSGRTRPTRRPGTRHRRYALAGAYMQHNSGQINAHENHENQDLPGKSSTPRRRRTFFEIAAVIGPPNRGDV